MNNDRTDEVKLGDAALDEIAKAEAASEEIKTEKRKPLPFAFDLKSLGLLAARAGFLLVIVFLGIYLVTVISASTEFFNDSSEKNAAVYFDEDLARVEMLVEEHYKNLNAVVDKLEYAKSKDEVEAVLATYIGSEQFGDIRYYSNGRSYSANGLEVSEEHSGADKIAEIVAQNERGCTGVYRDIAVQLDCIGFFLPVRGSAYVDGLLSIVPARNIVSVGSVINEKASVVSIIEKDGTVLSEMSAEGFAYTVGNNFYDFIDKLSDDKTYANDISDLIHSDSKSSFTVKCGSDAYTLAASPIDAFDGKLVLVTMSLSDGLIAPEFEYIRHIINLLLVAIIALIIGFVFAMLYTRKTKEAFSTAILFDSDIDCPNLENFKREAKERIYYPGVAKYSIVLFSIRSFNYLKEQVGEEKLSGVLKFVAKALDTFSNEDECYGYAGNGDFYALVLNKNSHSLRDKIKLILTVVNKGDSSSRGSRLRFNIGVYNVYSGKRRTVNEMIECAESARDLAEHNINKLYTVFSEDVRGDISRDEKIEAQMESALEQREFRLFLQPKYNIKNDKIDSAEALVRWFDPRRGEYMFPGEFISLFETNGFITKLDHFIYIEVLEYLSHAVERGELVVPISVNVSRITAVDEGFLDFYVGNKKKYRIADDFITIEFTENFAMEDYEKIDHIVTVLHRNGICCSIDDFGSGYSSFSILKQIDFDELKLDHIFIRHGADIGRDEKLLSTVVDLAKSMGMTVVQEGVETKDSFDKLVEIGCDVIQGYYYAKAMPLEEFRVFIKTNTSIKYKSLVK